MLRTVIESPDEPRPSNRRTRGLAPLLTRHPPLAGAAIALFLVAWLRILPLVIFTVREGLGFAELIDMSFSPSNVTLFAFDFCLYFAPVWVFALWFRGNGGRLVADVGRALAVQDAVPDPNASSAARIVFVAAGAPCAIDGPGRCSSSGLSSSRWWIKCCIAGFRLGLTVSYVVLSDAIFGARVLTNWLTRQTESFDLDVTPLHPDRAGGFSFIGKMLVAIAALLISIGLALVLGSLINLAFISLSSIPLEAFVSYYVAYGVAYLAAIYVLLWRPTQAVRSAMLRPRDRILVEIATELHRLEASVPSAIASKDEGSRRLGALTAEVRRLRSLSEAVQATYPVWPMSVRWTLGASDKRADAAAGRVGLGCAEVHRGRLTKGLAAKMPEAWTAGSFLQGEWCLWQTIHLPSSLSRRGT